MIGLLGRKIEMTQLFSEQGERVPVTVIKAGPCFVVQHRTKEKHGYSAIQIGFERDENTNKPTRGIFEKIKLAPLKNLSEIQVENPEKYNLGQELKIDLFQVGDTVAITGLTKGRGFSGGLKRHGWSGGPASHGSMSHRRVGSGGPGTSPGRIWKGKKLPGHYGTEKKTVKNLKVVHVDGDSNLLYVKGAVPGANKGLLLIKKS